MQTQEIPRDQWPSFFESFSRAHQGCLSTVEVLDSEIGSQVEAERLPLQGVAADWKGTGGNSISIMLGGSAENALTHTIGDVTHVSVERTDAGNDEVLSLDSAGGGTTLLHLLSHVSSEGRPTISAARVREIFAKLATSPPDGFFEHVADNVNWSVLGTHPLAGQYTSKREFRNATFARLSKLFDGGLPLFTRSVLVDGDQAAVELYSHATTRGGLPFNNEYCWICRFEGEQIVEVHTYLDSALVATVTALGASAP